MAVSLSVQSFKTRSTSYGVKKVYEIYKTVKANVPAKFVKVTFGTNGFDVLISFSLRNFSSGMG